MNHLLIQLMKYHRLTPSALAARLQRYGIHVTADDIRALQAGHNPLSDVSAHAIIQVCTERERFQERIIYETTGLAEVAKMGDSDAVAEYRRIIRKYDTEGDAE